MRIGIAGTFSSGKTTLAKMLHKKIPQVLKDWSYTLDINTERELAKALNFDFREHTYSELYVYQWMLFYKLLEKHIAEEKLITDNPLINTLGYTRDKTLKKLIEAISEVLYDLVILCEPLELEDDGIRHNDKYMQLKVQEIIEDYVDKLEGVRVIKVKGTTSERLSQIFKELKG